MNFDEWWNKEGLLYFGSGTEQDAREIWNAAQAAERESSEEYNNAYLNECAEMVKEAVESEREACAKVCDDRDMRDNSDESLEALRCAADIRARGQK